MNNTIFLNNFSFNEYCFTQNVHRDNSNGITSHAIGYMKHGSGLIIAENQRLEIKAGEMFYIPKGQRYHSYWIKDGKVLFDSIGFLYFPSDYVNGYSLQKIDYDNKIFNCFLPLSECKEINNRSIGQLYTLLSLLENVLTPAPSKKQDEIVNKFLSLINENHRLNISDYAQKCNVSEPVLYRYVKESLNKTPNELRQEYACRKAINLITSSSLSIEEICSEVGFSSSSYFRKVLKQIYGKTPSQIRKDNNII